MSSAVLGISAFYHDSAAAIVRDGSIVAAAQEERFTRHRHDPRFPTHAINYCLEQAFIEPSELDAIIFYDSPLLTWDRILRSCAQVGEPAQEQFVAACESVLGVKLWVEEHVHRALGTLGRGGRVIFSEHHMAHAASAFYPSPFDDAAILTLDGVGEWCTTSVGHGQGDAIDLLDEIRYPHSLGLLYSAFTYFCGFKVNSGEYKLMGLAPYGEPRYADRIREHLIDIRDDGSYRLDMRYFGYLDGMRMTTAAFDELFDGPPRAPESRISRRERDLAASIQRVITDAVLAIGRHARSRTGSRNLALAGGVALNCVANGELVREGIFDAVWIQPAAGDAGGALGAALLASHAYLGVPRAAIPDGHTDRQQGSYLGPAYSSDEVRAFLDRQGYAYDWVKDPRELADRMAEALDEGMIGGLFSGRMEFGPRSLGARSIIGDARRRDTQTTMNLKIKYRESFRPFAPSVLVEDAPEYFEIDCESPYMLLVAPVNESRRSGQTDLATEDMMEIVNQARSDVPAITHVDFSARVQTVSRGTHPFFHEVLSRFKERTGTSLLVNTSFNVRGEPIVCSPRDAYQCFMRTEMDFLVLEDCILWKREQPRFEDDEDWRERYGKD